VIVLPLGELSDAADIRTITLDARGRVSAQDAIVIATAISAGKPLVAVATTDSARSAGLKAGELVRLASGILGGGGGGKEDYAQGGGTDVSKLSEAINAIESAI
jgi:alanyl-tRNA synthetase